MPFLLSQLIEAARWIGALAVLAVHATNMFVNQADIMSAPHAALAYVWWFFTATEMGHQGVVGFFVISGWLVGGNALAKMTQGRDFLRDYFIHRVARIYVVLIPALLLTFAMDSLGRAFFADSGVYDWPIFQGHFSAKVFLEGLLSLQGIFFDYFGTNGPLWSLACEFWYYITFPLLLLPSARNYSLLLRLGGFVLGAGLVAALSAPESWFGFGFILWTMGAFATLSKRPLIASRWQSLALLALVVILIRLVIRGPLLAAHPSLSLVADLASATLVVNLLLSFREGPHEGFAALRWKIHAPLANFSFSLYAIHMPILILARAGVGHFLGRDWALQLATGANYAVAVIIMTAAIAVAYGFSRLTEARTGAARRVLRRIVDRVAPVSAPEAAAPEEAPERATAGS